MLLVFTRASSKLDLMYPTSQFYSSNTMNIDVYLHFYEFCVTHFTIIKYWRNTEITFFFLNFIIYRFLFPRQPIVGYGCLCIFMFV